MGRYATASEVLREALHLMIERDAERLRGRSSTGRSSDHHG
ncbi:MAG: type II toxin-antitoxin system ParD family antitoxin [Janthinobacterium lividum]